jgi:hypothetical protein
MKRLLFVAFASVLFAPFPLPAASPVILSEFMASNVTNGFPANIATGLRDDFGEFSDWIEIRNVSATNVNLLNWGLTDSRGDSSPWRFPSTNLSAGGFMVVFATGRDRAVAGAPLHTDFRLSSDGEYLALVDPDGNVATEFFPVYPPQVPNVSYGFGVLSSNFTFVTTNGAARVRVPASGNDGTNWTFLDFDDGAWTAATNGIGFGNVPALATDIASSMANLNASAYVRLPFTIGDPSNLVQLNLRLRYDDGFAAWVNGVEVARANAPDPLAFNSAATAVHSPTNFEEIRVTVREGLLNTGANVLAIQGLNRTATDSDFLLQAELIGVTALVDSPTPGYFFAPTPGLPNTGTSTNLGPAITEVQHAPNVPLDDEDLVVTARITPTFNAVTNVTMYYRIMFGETNSTPMFDDGLHGDGAAGDGVYGATISSSLSTNGQMVRYFVRATDSRGASSRWPLFTSPAQTAEYLGTVVNPDYVTSQLPIFHLFAPTNVIQAPRLTPLTQQSGADSENGGRVAIFYDGEFYDNVYMELRGNTSAGQNKKSHRLEFNREHPFRHLDEFPRVRKTSLMAEFLDPAYIRQHLSFWLLEQMGVPSPFFYPVRAQLNGAFYGLVFHNDVIDEEQAGRLGYDPAGAIYKAAGNCLPSETSTGVFQKKTVPFNDHSDYQALVRAINETNFPPGQPTSVALRRIAAFDMLDVPEIINYLAGARWTAENDDVWANMSLYRDTTNGTGDGLWRIIPFDMNASWGQRYGGITPLDAINDGCKSHPLYGGSTIIACDGSSYNRIYDVVIAVPELRQMMLRRERTVLDRWILEPAANPESRLLESHIRQMTNMIWTEAFLDRASWGYSSWTASNKPLTNAVNELFNEFINLRRIHFSVTHNITNVAKPIGLTPTSNAGIPQSQPTNAQILITAVEYNPASGNQAQEYLCVTNPNPYALDISGWKIGGGVDFTFKQGTIMPSNGVLYVSPDLPAFRARTVSPRGGQGLFVVGPYKGQLSARGETLLIVDDTGRGVSTNTYQGNPSLAQKYLRITEIMYHPAPLAGNTNDAQAFEYIELKNISTDTTLDLTNVKFVTGVEFNFTGSAITSLAPGQRVLVVKDVAAFTARYGSGLPVAGAFSGQLDNRGERLRLLDATNEEILDFDYNNSWYPITDGAGFSLVIVDENAEPDLWDSKIQWRPGGRLGGAPGTEDPELPPIAPIVINEILTHTDLPAIDTVELFNPTAASVSLGGWFLTDDFGTPKKYRIPNTNIVAGGYLTFDESQFNTPPEASTSFALSSAGDEIYLFSGDGTNLTGYVQGYSFGAAANGVSFGRYTDSQTNVHFVAQSAVTLGAANAGPKVGPIVISEINYHPPELSTSRGLSDNTLDEYIELRNISGAPVPLYDTSHPANTWRLRDAVSFTFPRAVTLPPGGFALVVGFEPRSGPALDAFRAVNNVAPGTPIYGPWEGKLNNSKNDVELVRPDAPDPGDGSVPSILVDKVDYFDSAPWPTNGVDGAGLSLQRIDLAAYGNDPINWQAGTRTPGGVAPTNVVSPPAIVTQPTDTISSENAGATLTVVASGSPPLSYQWFFNGVPQRIASSPTLTLSNLRLDQAGNYSCRVLNGAGSADSSIATLTVRMLARITQQPTNRPVIIAPDPRAARVPIVVGGVTNLVPMTNTTFTVAASSSYPPLTYQWRFNGVPVDGATGTTLTVTNVQLQDEGEYSCALTDRAGVVNTVGARLTPWIGPAVVQPPLSQTIAAGSDFTMSVEVTGHPPPFTYSWRRISTIIATNSSTLPRTFVTLNSTATGLILTNNILSTNYTMRLVVFNDANAAQGLLMVFNITVLADLDHDGLPDVLEESLGLSATNPLDASLDLDGDGMSNLAEYIAGTDPANSLSYLKIDSIVVGGGATLTFGAVSNKTYGIEYTDALGAGSWSRLTDFIARPTNRTETLVDAGFTTNRFYRVVTPRRP